MRSCELKYEMMEKHVNALPRNLRKEGLVLTGLDRPITDGDTNEVETCRSDLCKIFLRLNTVYVFSNPSMMKYRQTYNEGLVMLLELRQTAVGGVSSHAHAEIPFVECGVTRVDVLLVQSRGTEADMRGDKLESSALTYINCMSR